MHVRCVVDDTGITVAHPAEIEAQAARGLITNPEWQYDIYADTWEEAMTIHHAIRGWERYRPMEDV